MTQENADLNPPDTHEKPAAEGHAVSANESSTATSSVEATPAPPMIHLPDAGYTESGVPTFEGVREKIETRYGTAIGATELAEETTEVRAADQQFAARQKAAAEKLEEIRASMHKPE